MSLPLRIPALAALLLLPCCSWAHFLNEWAVQVKGGEGEAHRVAAELNCVVKAKIFDDTFLLSHNHVSKRSTEPHEAAHESIERHPEVHWAEQQKVLSRQKRQLWRLPTPAPRQNPIPDHYVDLMHLNDQRWPQMWYLNRGDRLDMNVQDAWAEGATGKGVSITILDDGIEHTHPDLMANYDPQASYDVNQNDGDPSPRYDLIDSNRHGTRCAGEVSATANNSECAVGIAYESGIGGVRMLDGDVTDAVEARSLGLNNNHVSIYSASWGPDDDGKTVDGPGRLASRAFLQGITDGRNGKGSIFVWASGNGGRDHDNCNCDGYTNSIWTLSVSSATENGLIPWYSEACSSTLASTYSSGSSGERKVVTTDLHHTCTSSHTGTSASAPLAAGIVALCLQVNPDLSWRDAQHLTVRCAHRANLRAPDWSVNGVGRNFSHSFGYGIMDASCMVRTAKKWEPVPEQKRCKVSADRMDLIIPGKKSSRAELTVDGHGCDAVGVLEHVQAHVTLAASKRGDVAIFLVSPQGTRSNLVAKRPRDYSRAGFNDWPFLTVHMWGESPVGKWTLEVRNDGRSIVELKHWGLVFHGTPEQPNKDLVVPPSSGGKPAPSNVAPARPKVEENPISQDVDASSSVDSKQEPLLQPPPGVNPGLPPARLEYCAKQRSDDWCDKCENGYAQHFGRCVARCPEEGYFLGKANRADACRKCYYSCKTCKGPNDYECLTCYGDAELEEESDDRHFCYNKSLVDRVFSSSRWYYVLSAGFVVNFAIVVVLVVYICRWRGAKREGSILPRVSGNGRANGGVASYQSGAGAVGVVGGAKRKTSAPLHSSSVTVPFHDYDSSSDDEELLRKPYTDDP